MPLGKILNLLLVALERISAKPAKVTDELQTTEELPSTTTVENTEVSGENVSNLLSLTEAAKSPQSEIFEEKMRSHFLDSKMSYTTLSPVVLKLKVQLLLALMAWR